MKEKILPYFTDEIKVTWDKERCIHAAECVRGLPDVFAPKRKPWIKPELADAVKIAAVIERCPTGALHYEFKNSENREHPPGQNVITINKDGPLYIYGEMVIQDSNGNIVLQDTRVALCRCGKSRNKPLCDNSHITSNFKAATSYDAERLKSVIAEGEGGELSIKVLENAPYVMEGNYTLSGSETGSTNISKKMRFCRCGGSSTKPFCDGTHKKIGFSAK